MKDKVKKALKRVASGLMAAIFAVCLVGTPRVKAVAVVDDVVVGAMSCEAFLASIGLPLTATGGSSAVTAGVAAAAGEYAAATGAAASGEAFLGTVAAGTAVSTAGAIVLTAAAAVALGAFAYWLYDSYLANGDTFATLYEESGYFDVNGLSVLDNSIPFGTTIDFGNGYYVCVRWSDTLDKKMVWEWNTTKGYYSDTIGYGKYTQWTGTYKLSSNYGVTQLNAYYTTADTGSDVVYSRVLARQDWSIETLFKVNKDSYCITLVNSDFQPIPEEELGPTKQMVIDVGAASGTTLADLAQTVPDAIANGQFAPTYVIQVAPSVDPVPVPVPAPEVDATPEVDAPEDIAPYTVGLGDVFPFCIPFDIYHMVTMFAAEPQAPAATWEFTLPWSGQECEVSWSLEEWDEVAKLCRSLELVLFCVGLAVATYKMIKW